MLEAKGVTVSQQGQTLLHEVDARLAPGELLMVLGPNGAGKSTLLKTLAGERIPEHGQVQLDGQTLSAWPFLALARRRAVLTQQVQIPFALSVSEVVELGLTPWQLRASRARQLVHDQLAQVGLTALQARSYLQLSGGEQQRVQLARVLVQLQADEDDLHGRYLLLDEPLAALDLQHQQAVLRLLRGLSARGLGILCVIHDVNLAALYGDRLLLLQRGRVRFDGNATQLRTSRQVESTYDADLIPLCHPETAIPQWQFRR